MTGGQTEGGWGGMARLTMTSTPLRPCCGLSSRSTDHQSRGTAPPHTDRLVSGLKKGNPAADDIPWGRGLSPPDKRPHTKYKYSECLRDGD